MDANTQFRDILNTELNEQNPAQNEQITAQNVQNEQSENVSKTETPEPSTGNAALDEILRTIYEAGAATNAQARQIAGDRTMLDALAEITGLDLSSVGQPASSMTASEQRTAVKNVAIQATGKTELRAEAEKLYPEAAKAQQDLDVLMRGIANDLGVSYEAGKQKSVDSMVKKVLRKGNGYTLLSMKDHARTHIELNNWGQASQVLDALAQKKSPTP